MSTSFFPKISETSMKILLSTTTLRKIWKIQVGVRLQAVMLYFNLMRSSLNTAAQPARKIIAWGANASSIKICPAKNTKRSQIWVRKIKTSCSLSKEPNSNNAQIANSGCKRVKDAITWPADANMNFVMCAVENIRNANVTVMKLNKYNHILVR